MKRLPLLIPMVLILISGCRPEIEVLAPEKELYVVWGILNPTQDVQYIKIGKVFQTEQDAYVYATENDLSAEGFEVEIHGAGKTHPATLEALTRDPGSIFGAAHQLYRIETPPDEPLIAGEQYELRVRKAGEDEIFLSATTIIPGTPTVTNPSLPVYFPNFDLYQLPTVYLENDYTVFFRDGNAAGFELRILVDYFVDGEPRTVRYGPTRIFREPVRCQANIARGGMCYQIPEKSVSRTLASTFNEIQGDIFLNDTIDVAPNPNLLSKSVAIEVTAIDSALATYMIVNQPFGFGLNLLIDKPVVSNISGENIGIFGSINTDRNYVVFHDCTKYNAGIIDELPGSCF